jgi:type IV secretory pathway VirB10-like protein
MILGSGEYEVVVLIIMVLIGVVTWIKEMLVRSAQKKRAAERQEEKPVPVSTKISREIRKYLGEIPEKAQPKPQPAAVHFKAPPPLPDRVRPRLEPEVETQGAASKKQKVRLVRRKAPRPVPRPRGVRLDRAGLRQAILHREILGPPVALRRMGRSASKLTRR